jgi:hypothetical protein
MFGSVTTQGETSSLGEVLSSCMKIDSANGNKIYLRNCGTGTVRNDSIRVYLDEAPIGFTMTPTSVGKGEIGTIELSINIENLDFGNHKLKITSKSAETERYVKKISTGSLTDESVLNLNFNEGSGIKASDSSSYHNDGIFYGETFNDGTLNNKTNGTITKIAGKFGNALNFTVNGTRNGPYVSLPLNSYLNVSQPVTITAWIYPTSFPDFIASRTTCCGTTMLFVDSSTFKASWGNYSQTDYVQLSGGTINLNTWYFVAFSYDSSGNAIIYVNGTNVGSTSKNATNYSDVLSTNWNIGQYWGGVQSFNGTIDEVRIWNRSLSQTEIQAEMSSSRPISRSIAAYSFEENSGQYANDTHIWVNGTYGSALSFDGIDDYVSVPNNESLEFTNQFTISAWFKPAIDLNNLPGGVYGAVGKKAVGTGDYGLDFCGGSNGWAVQIYNTSDGYELDSGYPAYANKWYYVTGTYDGTYLRLYVNGTEVANQNIGYTIRKSGQPFEVGHYWDWGVKPFWNGTIDEVRMWNRALSPTEIQTVMDGGQIAGGASSLVLGEVE